MMMKKLEQRIPKPEVDANATPSENEGMEEMQQQQQIQQQQQQDMMKMNPMMRNRNQMDPRQQQQMLKQAPQLAPGANLSGSSLLQNPLMQTALANNPLLAQQFAASGSNSRDPMEVIRKMKQSAQQLPNQPLPN
jgi:hypothetical protein